MTDKFELRPVQLSDKPEILDICSKIWDGEDFIPGLFDDWVKDKKGEFTAVIYGGNVIGCSKLSFLTDEDAWLQGLRKDLDSEVKGVAEAVTRHYLDKLRHYDNLKSIRFAAYYKEPHSVKAAEKCGFRKVKEFSWKHFEFDTDKNNESDIPARGELITDFERIINYIKESRYFEFMDNLICLDWEVHPYSDMLIKKIFIENNRCFSIEENGVIKALAAIFPSRGLSLSFFSADNEEYGREMLMYLKEPAMKTRWSSMMFFLPENPGLKKLVDNLGFLSWESENDYCLYEFPVENLKKFGSEIR